VKRLASIALCFLAAGASSAHAASGSVSYSTWIVSGNLVTLRFLLPVAEAQRLMGIDVPVLTVQKLEDYLLKHVTVRSAGGDCPAIDQGYDLGRVDPLAVGPDLYGFEIFYRCKDPSQLALRDAALFDRVPNHVNFARIQMHGRMVERLFTAEQQQLHLPDGAAPPAAGIATYLRLGVVHVLGSADRLCCLLGLLLLARRKREVGYAILALVLGYLLSVAVFPLGWVLPRMSLLEAFVGFLVALLGALMTLREAKRADLVAFGWPCLLLLLCLASAVLYAPWPALMLFGGAAFAAGFLLISAQFDARWTFWPLLALLLGFLDGFVLPSVLLPAQLPQQVQVRMSVGFDLGAVLIDALLAGSVLVALLLLRTKRIVVLQPLVNLVRDISAACLGGVGTFWLLSRL
jgi:hypothetical protein